MYICMNILTNENMMNRYVEQRQTYVVVAGERIEISIGEKNRRVEFIDNYGHPSRDLHPTGVLYIKKEGGSTSSKEWKDGPKKGTHEQQMFPY